jgi:hypothetical protein
VEDFGLRPDAGDDEILRIAVEHGLTLVTENDRHFVGLMRQGSARTGRVNCTGDGFGIVVPNHRTDIIFRDLTRRLHLKGKPIHWADVRIFNLRVSLGQLDPSVTALARCKFCVEDTRSLRARDLGLE